MVEQSDVLDFLTGAVGLINPVAGAAVGLIGGLISGSTPSVGAIGITAAQQAALTGGFGGPVTSTGTSVGPQVLSPGGFIPGDPIQAGMGGVVARAVPRIAAAVTGAGAVEVGSRMVLGPAPPSRRGGMTRRQLILAQARAFSPGATAKKVVRSARQCGIELSAATFGLSVLDVCFLIAQPATRRARGISAADLRRTRSTLRKVANIQHDLGHLKSPIRRRRK